MLWNSVLCFFKKDGLFFITKGELRLLKIKIIKVFYSFNSHWSYIVIDKSIKFLKAI